MHTKLLHYPPFFAAILISAFISGCGLSTPSSTPSDNQVTTLEIAPLFGTLPKGVKLDLRTKAYFSDGSIEENVSNKARWFSTNPEVLDVNNNGTLFTYEEGVSTISVTLGLLSIAKEVQVSNATVDFLGIEAESLIIRPSMPFTLSVFAFFTDGAKLDISKDIDWFVRNSGSGPEVENDANVVVKTFENNFFSLVPGESRITANYYDSAWNVSKTIVVNEVTLDEIRTSILYKSHIAGSKIAFNAFGYYSDGSILDVTSIAKWEDRNNNPDLLITERSATPKQAGEYEITASIGNVIDFSKFSVVDATFKSIEIAPLPQKLSLEETAYLQAYAIYDNGHAVDISNSLRWTSSNKTIIEVSNVTEYAGKAYIMADGTADVSASLSPFVEDTISIITSDATLVSIEITPRTEPIALGTSIQLNAMGTYSDGSIRDISKLVSWTSFQEEIDEDTGLVALVFDETILKVGNKRASAGRVETVRAKEAIIKAGFKGKSDSITLTVNDVSLESITLTVDVSLEVITLNDDSLSNVMYPDDQPTLTATGLFSDGTSQDISRQVFWESSNPNMLTVSNHPLSHGQLTQINFGQLVTITAVWDEVSESKQFTTTDASLTGLSIQANNENLAVGSPLQFSAVASYSKGSDRDVTRHVYWYTEDQNINALNSPSAKGVVIAKNRGDFTVYAKYQEQTASLSVTAD